MLDKFNKLSHWLDFIVSESETRALRKGKAATEKKTARLIKANLRKINCVSDESFS